MNKNVCAILTSCVLVFIFLLASCQKEEERLTPSRRIEYKGADPMGKDHYKVMDYGRFKSLYNFTSAPAVNPYVMGFRTVILDKEDSHQGVVYAVRHRRLIDGFIKDWRAVTRGNEFGFFDDSITATVHIFGTEAFPEKKDYEQALAARGASLPVDFACFPGFRSVQLMEPLKGIRVFLTRKGSGKFVEVTDKAFVVWFDPRVPLRKGGIGEGGKNLHVVRQAVKALTPEDWRWMNASFHIDIPRGDYGKFNAILVKLLLENGEEREVWDVLPQRDVPDECLEVPDECPNGDCYIYDNVPEWFSNQGRFKK